MSTRNNNSLVVEVRKQSQRVGSENPTNLGFKKSSENISHEKSNNFSMNDSNGNRVLSSRVSGLQKLSEDRLIPTINRTEFISSIQVKQGKSMEELAELNIVSNRNKIRNKSETKTPIYWDNDKKIQWKKSVNKTYSTVTKEDLAKASDVISKGDGEGKIVEHLCDIVSHYFCKINQIIHTLVIKIISLNMLEICNLLEQFYEAENQEKYITSSPSAENDSVPDKILVHGQEYENNIDNTENTQSNAMKDNSETPGKGGTKEKLMQTNHENNDVYDNIGAGDSEQEKTVDRYGKSKEIRIKDSETRHEGSTKEEIWHGKLRKKWDIFSGLVGTARWTQKKLATPNVTYESPPPS
jgi:hypothetical protein